MLVTDKRDGQEHVEERQGSKPADSPPSKHQLIGHFATVSMST